MRIFWAVVFMMMVFLKAGQGQLLDTTSNENDHLKRQCVNPNRRLGACVALDDCQVLQTSDEDFIIKSVCNEDFDKIPMVCCSSDVGFDAIPNGGHRNGKKLSWWPSVLKMFLSSLKSSNRNDFRPARKVKEPLVQNSLLPEPPICGGEFINNRIYGGTETHIYEFPWMAFLEYTKADHLKRQCVNPNRRLGACVALDDCQVLQTSDEDFIIKSVCNEDFDKIPMVCCSSDVGFDAIPNGGHRNGKKLSWWPSVLKMFLSSLKSSNRNDFRPARKVKEPLVQNSLLPEPPICGGEFINNRIYGGTETHIYEFPWMAFLEYTKADPTEKAICGGSLITSRSVITAAHCVVGKVLLTNGELISVRLGINDHTKQSLHSEDNNRWYIAKKIVHEDYNEHRSYMNDIALLRLARNVPYTKTIRPICLPSVMSTHHISTDTKLTVVGWGKTETRNHSPIRQKVNVLIADQKFCTKQYGSRGVIIDSTHICATGYLANQDSCFGDSGGPLMTHRDGIWVLDGIVSFGRGCGHSEWPGVYARVDQYTDWINKKINAKDIRK